MPVVLDVLVLVVGCVGGGSGLSADVVFMRLVTAILRNVVVVPSIADRLIGITDGIVRPRDRLPEGEERSSPSKRRVGGLRLCPAGRGLVEGRRRRQQNEERHRRDDDGGQD